MPPQAKKPATPPPPFSFEANYDGTLTAENAIRQALSYATKIQVDDPEFGRCGDMLLEFLSNIRVDPLERIAASLEAAVAAMGVRQNGVQLSGGDVADVQRLDLTGPHPVRHGFGGAAIPSE